MNGSYTSAINSPAALGIGVAIRWRHTASVTWENGSWAATLAQNFQTRFHDLLTSLQPATVEPRKVDTYETYEAQLSYAGFKSVRLTLGMKNIMGRDPPYTNHGADFVGGYGLSYTDVRGRFACLTATYTFK